ncbi:MAG TPA: ROK family transcriptional regulator [Solirubrobacteraceae bacterium]|nr:ROK family transcriptional regulator [Solirubrobacteraceae bacterium]
MTSSPASGSRAAAILRAVHAEPGVTRAALVRALGLSSGLATDTVARLVAARLVAETPAPASGSRGRPTQSLVAHPQGPVVAAVAISHDRWDLAIVPLGGAVIERAGGEHAGDWAAVRRLVRRRLAARGPLRRRLTAVSVSVPGTVSGTRLVQAATLGWTGIDLRELLPAGPPPALRWFGAGNDATLGGLGEARRGSARGARTAVYLHMDNGVGGALLLDGWPITGAQGLAGEFGHMPFGPRGRRCRCGAVGCWNAGLDGLAIADALNTDVGSDEVGFIVATMARAGAGGRPERRVLRRAASTLGVGTAALVNALDPELVCLGGLAPRLRAGGPEQLQESYRRGLMSSRAADPPPIIDGRLGADAVVIGAAEAGFEALFDDPGLLAWSS